MLPLLKVDLKVLSLKICSSYALGHAKAIISYLQEMQGNDQKCTMLQLVDKMKVKQKELGLNLKREHMEQLVIQLIIEHVLKEEFQHTAYATNAYVSLNPLAKQVLLGKKTVKLQICCEQEKKAGGIKSTKRKLASSNLECRLDELRKELASLHGGVFPHSILSTQQISTLAAEKPDSIEQLERIIGKVKSGKYGIKILEEIVGCSKSEKHDSEVNNNEQETDRATKKAKTQRSLVLIESSEDEK